MKVNKHVISNCRSLPPNVEGELSGALTMQVDEIVWCKKIATEVSVYVQWWGEQEPSKFRPSHCNHDEGSGFSAVFTYRIYTPPKLFYSYLEDSKQLCLFVVDERCCSCIGRATLCNLRAAFTKQSSEQICLPVIDGSGVKVADLCLSLTLKFFENLHGNKIFVRGSTDSATKPPTQRSESVPASGVPDSLVMQLLRQAQRLRDAMANSVLQDWEEADTYQCSSDCQHSSMLTSEELFNCLLGDVDGDVAQRKAAEVLNESPTAELLGLVASFDDSPREMRPASKFQHEESHELLINKVDKLKEVADGSLKTSAVHDGQQIVAHPVIDGMLNSVVSMRVCINSLSLERAPKHKGTYFVDYKVPLCLVADNAPLSRTTCSRRIAGRVVQFGQQFVHMLSQRGVSLAVMLSDLSLSFTVYCRQLSERKRSLLGQASMSLANLGKTENLEVQRELDLRGVGKLSVTVQLGCDKVQFGRQLFVNGKLEQQPNQFSQTRSPDDPQRSATVEKLCLPTDCEEGSGQLLANAQSNSQLLYALLHVPWGCLVHPCSSYVVCRAFWRDHVFTSDVVRDECNPRYNLRQVLPLLLSAELLERCRNNVLVLEVWRCVAESVPHALVGLAKVSLHPFYLAYKDPVLVSQLMMAKYPVVSADRSVPVVCPSSGTVRGELRVLLALGSQDQVLTLGAMSETTLRAAGSGPALHASEDVHSSQHDVHASTSCDGGKDDALPAGSASSAPSHREDSPRHRVDQHETANFSSSRPDVRKHKNKGVSSSRSSYLCDCSREGKVCPTHISMRRTCKKWASVHGNFPSSENNVRVSQDGVTEREGLGNFLSSSGAREKRARTVCQNCDTSDDWSSDGSSDREESANSRKVASVTDVSKAQGAPANSSDRCGGGGSRSDLHEKLMCLNLAGGDTLQLASAVASRRQPSAPALTYEHELEVVGHKRPEKTTAVDHGSTNCFSPGHSSDARFTNIESFSDIFGEVGCGDCVDAGRIAQSEDAVQTSDSPRVVQEEECRDSFCARVKVEQAMYLKLGASPCAGDEHRVYVTFQANSKGLQLLASPAVQACEAPVWEWYCDTQLAADVLTNEEKRLVLKVWQMAGSEANSAADHVLGFTVVDLTYLLRGFSFVSGWYGLVDYAGCCVGQIKVTVVPLEDLSRFIRDSREVELHSQESHQLDSDLYSNLKVKLGELDEITARLRRRLDTVVSNESTLPVLAADASTQVVGSEGDVAPVSCRDRTLEDKCIQTSVYEEDPDSWTDWLMGMTARDLELENVFNPLLFQPLISSCVEQSVLSRDDVDARRKQSACAAVRPSVLAQPRTTAGRVNSGVNVSRSQTVAQRLLSLWSSPNETACTASRQAPDGVSISENSPSVSQLSVLEQEIKKTSKTCRPARM